MSTSSKRLSGAQQRKSKVARGLPARGPRELASRKAESRRRVRARREQALTMVNEIKLSRGCADCGYAEHAVALEFDHLPGTTKVASINELVGRLDINGIRDEIEKCEVVCANCHRVRTQERALAFWSTRKKTAA